MNSQAKLLGGILLVSGTTIGAAILALPVITGFAGFFPSIALLVFFWLFMTYTAYLMLEVNLSMKGNVNLISMAKNTLGRWGEALSWITYLFLLYALTTAYIAGSGPIFTDFIHLLTGYTVPKWAGSLPLLAIFGFFVYRGTKSVDYINRILMFGLIITYTTMVIFLTPHVETSLLLHVDIKYLWVSISIVATSFGFHIIIPSLTTYFHKDVNQLKKAIFIGSAIPLLVYIVWELLTLGVIPLDGANGLNEGFKEGSNAANLLSAILGNSLISLLARFFSFFAIVTSFLGVSLSLSHFLADGFKIKETKGGDILVYILTFLPPLVFTLTDPRAFLSALEFAGAFGVIILLGLLPALMVWSGRYYKNYNTPYKAPGNKGALILTILVSTVVVVLEVLNQMGWMNSPN